MARVPAEQRRRQLLAAALQVVATDGVAAASTRRIALEARLPPAVVHYCFRSVEDLIDALTASLFDEMIELAAVALRSSGAVEHSVRAALHRLWASCRADPGRHKAMFDLASHALRRPATAMVVRDHQGRLRVIAERFLTDIAARNNATLSHPAGVLGHVLLSTVDGVLLAWLVDRDDGRTEAALDWLAASIAAAVMDSSARN